MRSNPKPALPTLEPLEPRVVLSTNFASVGLFYGQSTFDGLVFAAFNTEGTVFDNGSVAGNLWSADDGGRDLESSILYNSISWFGDGRFTRDPNRGYDAAYAETNGAQFRDSEGYGLGWWFGDGGVNRQELEYLVELGEDVVATDFQGIWRFSMTLVNYGNGAITTIAGRITIDEDSISWSTTLGLAPRNTSTIDTIDSNGTITTDQGEKFYLNKDKDAIVFADLDIADDVAVVGVAIKTDSTLEPADLVGGYHTAWAYTDTPAGANDIFFQQTYLDLEADGDYKIYDLDAWDDGDTSMPLERGFWRFSQNTLFLQLDDSTQERRMYIGTDAQQLLGFEYFKYNNQTSNRIGLVGAAVRAQPDGVDPGPTPGPGGNLIFAVPGTNTNGRPAVYELRADGNWYTSDVTIETAGPAITGAFTVWTDPKDGRAYAAAITDQGLLLFREEVNDVWSYRNLTTEITGAVTPATGSASQLTFMVAPDDRIDIITTAADGDILRYYQDGTTTEGGEYAFRFQNITAEDLEPNGATVPDYAGDLVAYATSWGGLNIAGIDTSGNIWSVWWAPGRARWSSTNLTSSLGAESLVGGLTVFLTTWNAINIAGINTTGNLVATWWVPSFGPDWQQVDLTATIGAPQLTPESVTSFVAPWGALNVVGADATTGDVLAYWWSPARTGMGWTYTSLTDAVPSTSPALVRDLLGTAESDNSLNVFGYDATDDLVRYFWYSGQGWQAQNITDTAIDGAPPVA